LPDGNLASTSLLKPPHGNVAWFSGLNLECGHARQLHFHEFPVTAVQAPLGQQLSAAAFSHLGDSSDLGVVEKLGDQRAHHGGGVIQRFVSTADEIELFIGEPVGQ